MQVVMSFIHLLPNQNNCELKAEFSLEEPNESGNLGTDLQNPSNFTKISQMNQN